MRNKILAYLATLLLCLQILLILVSWILTSAMPDDFSRALLSAEGIRWFLGRFVSNLSSPLLVALLLCAMADGAVEKSGLLRYDAKNYRQRIAMRFVMAEGVLLVLVILLLTMVPHAILLNVLGTLYPSSFSAALLPYCCFGVILTSLTFGVMSERLKSVTDMFATMCWGISKWSGGVVLYVIAMQFYCSCLYLFDY